MGTNPIDDITEGLERIHKMFPEDHVQEIKTPKNPIEAMGAAGVDMNALREAVGGHFDNILHVEQVDETNWRLRVRRITRSGNYTETITVTTNSGVLLEDTIAEGKTSKKDQPSDKAIEDALKMAKEKKSSVYMYWRTLTNGKKDFGHWFHSQDASIPETMNGKPVWEFTSNGTWGRKGVFDETNVRENQSAYSYRMTPLEAIAQAVDILGEHLVKAEAVRGDDRLLAIHIRESRDARALHQAFADLNASLHDGGWHATMREDKRWTMSPMAGAFLEKRATLRAAGKGEHLYPPAHYAGRSTDALLRSSEYRDNAPVKEDAINESDARKRAFKAGYPMVPQHALAQSTDAIMYPSIGDNDKVRDQGGNKSKESKKKSGESSVLNKAVDANGDFL